MPLLQPVAKGSPLADAVAAGAIMYDDATRRRVEVVAAARVREVVRVGPVAAGAAVAAPMVRTTFDGASIPRDTTWCTRRKLRG